MIKLVPAKCPCCDANIEVNENFKQAMCQYCGSMILVDDAIQKIKVEHTGNVKVKGILDEDDKLDIIRKHIKLEKYDLARAALHEILVNNPYNLEALKLIVEVEFEFVEKAFKIKLSDVSKDKFEVFYYMFDDEYVDEKLNTIKGLDEDGIYSEFISSCEDAMKNFKQIKKEFLGEKKVADDASKRLIEKCNKFVWGKGDPDSTTSLYERKNIPRLFSAFKIDERDCDDKLVRKYGLLQYTYNCEVPYPNKVIDVGEDYIVLQDNSIYKRKYKFKAKKKISLDEKERIIDDLNKSIFDKLFGR